MITKQSELVTALTNWLGRSDLAARIPEFIQLAEADIRRNLDDAVIRAPFALTLSNAVALPADNNGLRSIRYDTNTKQYPLVLTTSAALAGVRQRGSGAPFYYAVVANTLLLDIVPDTAYNMEIEYFAKNTPLNPSDGNSTNYTLTNSPDIYLFGAMKEAEPYLEHDERNILWSQKYQKAVTDENDARERAEMGAAPVVPRLPIVLG